jgi:hypothetical protein
MQTFLPFPDYAKSAEVLDNRRLGKQRVECLQLLKALHDPSYGWKHHPATKMWRGHETSLVEYGVAVCLEWRRRGFKDTCLGKIAVYGVRGNSPKPDWLTFEFCQSHQSNLIQKDPPFYGPKFPGVPKGLPYVWPVQ